MALSNPLGQHYTIQRVMLDVSRGVEPSSLDTIDITALVEEVTVTEVAYRPYLVGQILIVDQNDMMRAIHMRGSERVTITLAPAQGNQIPTIERTFILRGLNSKVRSDIFVYDLVEEAGYAASAKAFAKSYTGRLEDIIEKILNGKLNRQMALLYPADNYTRSARTGVTHVNIPYMTPWEALTWLTDRMTGKTGAPWFLSSSLYSNTTNLWSMEECLISIPFNIEQVFIQSERYTQATQSTEVEASILADTAILGHQETNTESMHHLERSHSIAGQYDLIDTDTNQVNQLNYDLATALFKLESGKFINQQDVLDPTMTINDQAMAFTPSTLISQATSANTYLLGQSYTEDVTAADTQNKISNKMLKNVMIQKSLTVALPGKLFAAYKATVGRKVRMHFESGDRVGIDQKFALDKKLSGDYVITGIHHVFSGTTYTVNVDGIKLHRSANEQ
tara:strand:+ start:625 stop:1974 length:1350 start_codon:yes stop_codon:yes gene_type:complete